MYNYLLYIIYLYFIQDSLIMFFKIKCYIREVIDKKKIKIEIEDDDEYIKMNKNMQLLYKTNYIQQKIFNINISNCKINIFNNQYNNLEDLKGIEVYISGYSKYYNFQVSDDDEKKIIKGYSLIGTKINDNIPKF